MTSSSHTEDFITAWSGGPSVDALTVLRYRPSFQLPLPRLCRYISPSEDKTRQETASSRAELPATPGKNGVATHAPPIKTYPWRTGGRHSYGTLYEGGAT